MPTQKPHRIRVRVIDGKPREPNKLRSSQLGMPHLDVLDAKDKVEFVICAVNEKQIAQVRDKLNAAGLEEMPDGDTNIAAPAPKGAYTAPEHHRGGSQQTRGGSRQPQSARQAGRDGKKPYGFVPLPEVLTSSPPVWHDGTSTDGRLSGEIRFELETLTPLLVGWERRQVGEDHDEPWPVPASIDGVGQLTAKKSVLCPLRAPWGKRPVIIPGDSLKGLLRHELGALLGAPLERVAERSYSYRPNALFPNQPNSRLIARLARVPKNSVETRAFGELQVCVPTRLELFPADLEYNKKANRFDFRFDQNGGAAFRGGQGAGQPLNSKRKLHHSLKVFRDTQTEGADVPVVVQEGYLATLRHLTDDRSGHFSERHPDHSEWGAKARERILKAATDEVFQPGDIIWVEWDTEQKRIVSLGWHYYYRWAYTDSVRQRGGGYKRHGLFPLEAEQMHDDEGAPRELSPIRRLFGYTGDNEGSAGIGEGDHAQLMGRVSVNAALEVIEDGDTDDTRFLKPMLLKELGMPRPSAVEHYLKQPYHPNSRPSDKATLVTYGDAAGYDTPGELAGRKFYLDRGEAYRPDGKSKEEDGPWADATEANRINDRSTLALEASKPQRKFRFTVRFRDLDAGEIATILVALCPHQFRGTLGGTHTNGYCSKLGYARPLGWGSVRIEAKALLLLDAVDNAPILNAVPEVVEWIRANHRQTGRQREWLDVHRHKHPDAAAYPLGDDGNIYTFHTNLRAEHSRKRRYRQGPSR